MDFAVVWPLNFNSEILQDVLGGGCSSTHRAERPHNSPLSQLGLWDDALKISQPVLKTKTLESGFRERSKSSSSSWDAAASIDISVQMAELAAETPAVTPSWTSQMVLKPVHAAPESSSGIQPTSLHREGLKIHIETPRGAFPMQWFHVGPFHNFSKTQGA